MPERDENGKFIKGNGGGPGRPNKQREGRYYDVLITTVTFERWKKIVLKAAEQAERGDQAARKWLADYLIGAPVQRTEVSGKDGGAITVQVISGVKYDSL